MSLWHILTLRKAVGGNILKNTICNRFSQCTGWGGYNNTINDLKSNSALTTAITITILEITKPVLKYYNLTWYLNDANDH